MSDQSTPTPEEAAARLLAGVPLIRCRIKRPFGPEASCVCPQNVDGPDCSMDRPFTLSPAEPCEQPTPADLTTIGHAVSAQFHDPLTPGTPVLAWPGSRDSSPLVTVTRSEVWTLGGGDRVVMVEGHAGGIALTHVDVLPAGFGPVRAVEAEREVCLPAGSPNHGDRAALHVEGPPHPTSDADEVSLYFAEHDVECIFAKRADERLIARAEQAEAESANLQHDYDARGERLWRLAALAGHVPQESDNDATAELVVSEAVAKGQQAEAREKALRESVEALADEIRDGGPTENAGGKSKAWLGGERHGRHIAAFKVRALLATSPDREDDEPGGIAPATPHIDGGLADTEVVKAPDREGSDQ